MRTNLDTYNVLWSQQHNQLHIETMEQTVKSGLEAFKENRLPASFSLIATGLTADEATALGHRLQVTLDEREVPIPDANG